MLKNTTKMLKNAQNCAENCLKIPKICTAGKNLHIRRHQRHHLFPSLLTNITIFTKYVNIINMQPHHLIQVATSSRSPQANQVRGQPDRSRLHVLGLRSTQTNSGKSCSNYHTITSSALQSPRCLTTRWERERTSWYWPWKNNTTISATTTTTRNNQTTGYEACMISSTRSPLKYLYTLSPRSWVQST